MYEISKNEISVLRAVIKGCNTLSEIQKETGLSISRISELSSELIEKGYLIKIRKGMHVNIFLSENKHSHLFKRLILSELSPESVLHNSKLNILFSILHSAKKPERIAIETSLSLDTVIKYLKSLKKFGVIYSKGEYLQVSPSVPILSSFLQEYASYINRKNLTTITSEATIIWEQGREMIFRASIEKKIKKVLPTAITALSTYGIDVISEFSYYYYAPWAKKLRPEDIAVHTILLDKSSVRYLSYALLLFKKVGYNKEYLLMKGREYMIENIIKDVINYLNEKKPKTPFPSKDGFKMLCAQYGID